MTDKKPVSQLIRETFLKDSLSYSLAGLWSGGVVAITNETGDRPGLFFQVADSLEDWPPYPKLPEGLELRSSVLNISGSDSAGVLLALSRTESIEPFLSMVDYLFDRLVFHGEMTGISNEVFNEVTEWISYWKISGKKPMREVVMGLVGELLTITNLLRLDNLNFDSWEGPAGGNHDFRAFGNSVEVKVCGSRSGGLVHKISSQQQLQSPEGGNLFIHSLRLQLGRNLPNKVSDLMSKAKKSGLFEGPDGEAYFERSIGLILGGTEIPEEISTYELLDQHIFFVDEGFPRIEPRSLASGVIDVSYSVDLTTYANEETRCFKRSFDLKSCELV